MREWELSALAVRARGPLVVVTATSNRLRASLIGHLPPDRARAFARALLRAADKADGHTSADAPTVD